jgi:Tol biopolymer transport system component
MRAGGSGERRLLASVPGQCPQLSPHGRRIAVSRNGQLWIAGADGTGLRQLTHPRIPPPEVAPGEHDGCPVWSPDGKSIAYPRVLGDYPESSELRTVSADGRTDRRVLFAGWRILGSLGWKPDGSALVFSASESTGMGGGDTTVDYTVETVRRDGGRHRILDRAEGFKLGVAWSPDGSRIAFSHLFSYGGEGTPAGRATGIYTMSAIGGGNVRLVRAGVAPATLSWQPL